MDATGAAGDTDARSMGRWAERMAGRHLEGRGLTCLARNYQCRHGEIDLVLSDGQYIVFVEVRYRKNSLFGGAAASIDRGKQKRILATAQHYLQKYPAHADKPCRCDAMLVSGTLDSYSIDWIQGAFSLS